MKVLVSKFYPRLELSLNLYSRLLHHEVNIVFQVGCYNFCLFALTTAVKISSK